MKIPSKITTFSESSYVYFAKILTKLRAEKIEPAELYHWLGPKKIGTQEFIEVLDCLYALGKIDYREGDLFYVEENSLR